MVEVGEQSKGNAGSHHEGCLSSITNSWITTLQMSNSKHSKCGPLTVILLLFKREDHRRPPCTPPSGPSPICVPVVCDHLTVDWQ